MTRRTVSLLVLALVFLLILWLAPSVLLVVFAGILVAVLLRGGGNWIARKLNIGPSYGLALFCVALVLAAAVFIGFAGAALANQVQILIDSLPDAIEAARGYVDKHGWIQRGIDMVNPSDLAPSGGATTAFNVTFGFLGNAVVILFVGLYGAVAPATYVNGFTALFSPSLRPKVRAMLKQATIALRGWLRAQFISMTVVGVLTGLGLWALGVPLAPILAVLAALLTFIPNLGPIMAAVPAILLGFADGLTTAMWIAGLYVVVQTVESYFITPRVQEEVVSLPPALTISAQLLFGLLFGIMGLALATPLAAVVLRVGDKFYVDDYLEEEALQTQA